jgi:hypothetical protein
VLFFGGNWILPKGEIVQVNFAASPPKLNPVNAGGFSVLDVAVLAFPKIIGGGLLDAVVVVKVH